MSRPLRVRIVSDSSLSHHFRILDAETGEEFTNINRVTFEVEAGETHAVVRLEIVDFEVDAVAEVDCECGA